MSGRKNATGPFLGAAVLAVALLAYDDRLRGRFLRLLEDFFSAQGQLDVLLITFLGLSVVLVILMVRL